MQETPATPAAFIFEPRQPERTVAAFGTTFRLLAWAMLVGLVVWMGCLPEAWQSRGATWGAAAWLIMAWTVWHIQRSRTQLGREGLHQSWIWDKRMAIGELAYARVIRVRGLEWLVAPRLYVRNLSGRFTVIYCSDPALLEDMQRLCEELQAFHQRRWSGS